MECWLDFQRIQVRPLVHDHIKSPRRHGKDTMGAVVLEMGLYSRSRQTRYAIYKVEDELYGTGPSEVVFPPISAIPVLNLSLHTASVAEDHPPPLDVITRQQGVLSVSKSHTLWRTVNIYTDRLYYNQNLNIMFQSTSSPSQTFGQGLSQVSNKRCPWHVSYWQHSA